MSDTENTEMQLISLWQDQTAWEYPLIFQELFPHLEAIRRALKERAELLSVELEDILKEPLQHFESFEVFRSAARSLLTQLASQHAGYDIQTHQFYRFYMDFIYADRINFQHQALSGIDLADTLTFDDGSLCRSYQCTISNGILNLVLDDCNDPEHHVNALEMGFSSANTTDFYLSSGLPLASSLERLMDPYSWIKGMYSALNKLIYPVTLLEVFSEHLSACTYRHKTVYKTSGNGSPYITFNGVSQTISGDPSMESLWEQCPWEYHNISPMFGAAFADSDRFTDLDGSIVLSQRAERSCFSSILRNGSQSSCRALPLTLSLWEKRSKNTGRHPDYLEEDNSPENIWIPLFTDLEMTEFQSIPFESRQQDLPSGTGAWQSDHCRVSLKFRYDFEQERERLKFQLKSV